MENGNMKAIPEDYADTEHTEVKTFEAENSEAENSMAKAFEAKKIASENAPDSPPRVIEILSDSHIYPEAELSNFAPYPFTLDGVFCGGMEGFLQSLKFFTRGGQLKVAGLCGKSAKRRGEKKRLWKLLGRVFWQGRLIRRDSHEFDSLITRAYDAMLSENEAFASALRASLGSALSHKIGKHKKRQTILTEEEFLAQLGRLRASLE